MVATIGRALPSPCPDDAERLRQFEGVCLRDMAALAGVADSWLGRRALEAQFGERARRFARDLADFDDEIAACGVEFATRQLMVRYGGQIVAKGVGHVPRDGPVLFIANHPGLMDSLAIYATAPRPDVRALARPQPLLLLLAALAPNLLLLPDEGPERGGALRSVVSSLRAGGALVLFPAGRLEPEPCLPETGAEPLGPWSSGLGTLVRLAARDGLPLRIVPTAVSGVLSTETWRRFRSLIRLRRT
ncbi:MAG: 1-acyl-sn-glycerol-3-phosphate acyltransferase, partial [Chloroflexota bacterium]|nr:1-acyl-sn-glycerol-3-phosphate acyltransferase [Chloroflexota bacterium]